MGNEGLTAHRPPPSRLEATLDEMALFKDPVVLKAGMLSKRGRLMTPRSMERYYVILSTGAMRYFKTMGPAGENPVSWPGYSTLGEITKATSQDKEILIVTKDREHRLTASTPTEATEWARVIRTTLVNSFMEDPKPIKDEKSWAKDDTTPADDPPAVVEEPTKAAADSTVTPDVSDIATRVARDMVQDALDKAMLAIGASSAQATKPTSPLDAPVSSIR